MTRKLTFGYLYDFRQGPNPAQGWAAHYAQVLAADGGPALPRELLDRHFDLSVALMLVALMIDVPALVLARVPDLAAGPHDPLIRADQVAHGFLHVFANALMLWATRDFGQSLRAVLEREPEPWT